MVNVRQSLALSPARIAMGYLGFGVLWIGLSDRAVFGLFTSESTIALAQTVKGWVFVGVSATLIFGLSRLHEGQLAASEQRALAATEQLQVLHRIFRHNIRNELTVIHGYANLVLDRTERERTDEWAHGILESSTDLLETSEKLGIVNEVDFVAGGSEPVDLVPILENEVAALRSTYPGATIEVHLPDRLVVAANPSIQYAIREALQNAMDHHRAPEPDRRIEISTTETVGEVRLEIADNGPGIHRDEIEPVLLGTETPLDHGSGIGLWLISWICESAGGSATFDSGDGTTVSMTLDKADPLEQVTDRIQHELYPTFRD